MEVTSTDHLMLGDVLNFKRAHREENRTLDYKVTRISRSGLTVEISYPGLREKDTITYNLRPEDLELLGAVLKE